MKYLVKMNLIVHTTITKKKKQKFKTVTRVTFKTKASLVAQTVKNPPAMCETWVGSLRLRRSPGGRHGNPL